MTTNLKFCIECKHCETQKQAFTAQKMAAAPDDYACQRKVVSLITGKTVMIYRRCEDERGDPKGCGKQGKYWETKPVLKTVGK